jgi:replicative DNA helicase
VYDAASRDKGIAELIIAKQRMGPIGMVGAAWLGEYGAFGDVDWTRSEEPREPAKKERASEYAGERF